MVRILYFIRALDIGGAETFILNTLNHIDKKKFHIDFVLQSKENKNTKLINLCKKCGCYIYYIERFEKNYLKSVKQLVSILKKGEYNIIHIHANALINMVPIIAANKTSVKIALHSHNTKNNLGGLLGYTLHMLNRRLLKDKDIIRFACSEEAGKWMYGKNNFTILNNAIDLDTYKFNEESRMRLRKQYGFSDKELIIGHVGRFVPAKNHQFLIDVYDELIKKQRGNYKLLLIGDGELKTEIERNVLEKNLDKDVIFVGVLQNTSDYYSLFDLMVFPSLFEGLPFALIEAQAAGVRIIASKNVTSKVNITNTLNYVDLQKSASEWADIIADFKPFYDREALNNKMKETIFDSKVAIKLIENEYLRVL